MLSDNTIFKQCAEVYGILVRLGGTKIVQVVENDVDFAVKWISVSNPREIKKYASILVLKELLYEAPIITFTKIFAIESAL